METETTLNQNSRFKISWTLLLVIDALMTLSHFALIFILDEPNLFIGFTLFNLYALFILLIPFRRGETWGWLATWILPVGLALPAASDANIRVYYFGAAAVCILALIMTMQDFFSKR